jgi:hypothetical protein
LGLSATENCTTQKDNLPADNDWECIEESSGLFYRIEQSGPVGSINIRKYAAPFYRRYDNKSTQFQGHLYDFVTLTGFMVGPRKSTEN